MYRKKLAVGLAIVLGIVLAVGKTEARHRQRRGEHRFTETLSGSTLQNGTLIDTDGDGRTANFTIWSGENNLLGPITYHSVSEYISVDFCTCPNGNDGFCSELIMGSWVRNVERSGDLLYGDLSSGTACFDFTTGLASLSAKGTITGGTGRLEGATGIIETSATVIRLIRDSEGHGFAAGTARSTGTINIP